MYTLTHSLFLLLCLVPAVWAQQQQRLVDLRGQWQFEIGDAPERAAADYNDSDWTTIFVPGLWEDEGFPEYDGFAWYRKTFVLPVEAKGGILLLILGYIDDADEVYLNGRRIGGMGSFPPHSETAYAVLREYPVPLAFFNKGGINTLAVRVYDQHLGGGITGTAIGVYQVVQELQPELDLSGIWKFRPGDDLEWRQTSLDDSRWDDVLVPGRWEQQGYEEIDGFAWYRLHFSVPADLKKNGMALVLGRIDDFDEVFLNGQRIGSTGDIAEAGRVPLGSAWQEMRGYPLPENLLQIGRDNILAVRVFDGFRDGGIYQGPVGILPMEQFRRWRKEHPDNGEDKSKFKWWEWLIKLDE